MGPVPHHPGSEGSLVLISKRRKRSTVQLEMIVYSQHIDVSLVNSSKRKAMRPPYAFFNAALTTIHCLFLPVSHFPFSVSQLSMPPI